jgi:O-methyltransferase
MVDRRVPEIMDMRRTYHVFIRPLLRKIGIDLVRYGNAPADLDEMNIRIYNAVRNYTMTSVEMVNALIEATKYVIRQRIDGDLVECGVWKGGSVMAMALTLKEMGESREIYLYDTFSGMCSPSEADGDAAREIFSNNRTSKNSSKWLFCPIEEVENNVTETGYPIEKCHFIKGKVEDTIPEIIPQEIALLRLDTDFYESTKHELTHLFPRLSPKGVIILDDYGFWKGARKAVDEYIMENKLCIFLNRVDNKGRIAIKMPD